MNSFIFVCSRRCKNSTPAQTLAHKSTSAVAFGLQKGQTATALLTRCKAHAAAFVSVVSAGCLVHFLTLVSNYSISQRASTARFVSFVRFVLDTVRGVRFRCVLVVSCITVQSYNIITTCPNITILKNVKRIKIVVLRQKKQAQTASRQKRYYCTSTEQRHTTLPIIYKPIYICTRMYRVPT